MRSWSKWSGPCGGSLYILIAALSLSVPARAQSGDAGAGAPAEPPEPAEAAEPTKQQPAADEAREEPQAPGAAGAQGAEQPPPGLKTLTPSQRLPENLQGWMRERQRRNPALVERRTPPAQPALAQQRASDDPSVDVLKRRLRSFDEGGVTVLSNRHAPQEPIGPALTRVAAAAAVSRPAVLSQPPEAPEAEVEEPVEPAGEAPSVETRSLRAQPSPRATEDATLRWPAWLAVCAALGLAVVWLRKRRAVT